MHNSNNGQNGFTLVELAIVLMIIGLLIGGILRGQELMHNAENTATIQQVKAYHGAIITFRDAYAGMPGDIATASQRLPGCQAGNGNSCVNGNGDGIVGAIDNYAPWMAIDATIAGENSQFWKHLALAHMISGVTPSATADGWGQSHPSGKLGGGFFIHYSIFDNQAGSKVSSHYLVTRRTISGNWDCGVAGANIGSCTTSPQRASQIDRKMDDGIALTGDAIAISASWTTGCGTANSGENGPDGYSDGKTANACDMMFAFN